MWQWQNENRRYRPGCAPGNARRPFSQKQDLQPRDGPVPRHKKWVREIGETLPNTFAMVVKSITDLDWLYAAYQAGDKSVYAVFSKEKARDGYMRYPAVTYDRMAGGFRCPDCGEVVQMTISDDGTKYEVNADQFYFMKEHRGNRYCVNCGTPLWSAINPGQTIPWAKIHRLRWVYRPKAAQHRQKQRMSASWPGWRRLRPTQTAMSRCGGPAAGMP